MSKTQSSTENAGNVEKVGNGDRLRASFVALRSSGRKRAFGSDFVVRVGGR